MPATPKTLTVTECHQLINALLIKDGTKNRFRKGVRNYLMALLMLDAGLRVGEVVRLRYPDLIFAEQAVRSIIINDDLAEKDCQRQIPVSFRLSSALETMNNIWWSKQPTDGRGFCFYTTDPAKPLTTRQVERILRAAALKCLGRPVHPHVLRHTFASKLMRKTNARIVQELLGHKNIASTQIYTHPNNEDLRNAIDQVEEAPHDDMSEHLQS